jgi:TetR/AcrR family transcriptional regulator, transcriptional repressor for nem operon
MRFEKGHKEKTRRRILDVASRRFRRDGVAASGLAGIMTEAGLTNGAFYPHFESKESLLREALANTIADQRARLEKDSGVGSGIEGAIRGYLNKSHLEGGEEGCPSAALLPEIGRQSEPTRKAYEDGLLTYISALAAHLPDPRSASSKRRAMAVFGLMVGTLQIARAVADEALAEDILEGGIEAALSLAKEQEPTNSGVTREKRSSPSRARMQGLQKLKTGQS